MGHKADTVFVSATRILQDGGRGRLKEQVHTGHPAHIMCRWVSGSMFSTFYHQTRTARHALSVCHPPVLRVP